MDTASKQQQVTGGSGTSSRPQAIADSDSGQHIAGIRASAMDSIADLYFALDEQGTLIDINTAVETLGYCRHEVLGRHLSDWVHPDDRSHVIAALRQSMARGSSFSSFQEFRLLSKKDQLLWFEAHSAIRFTADGVFQAHAGICRDITQRIRDQEALQQQIRIRTAELAGANEALRKEITERRETEQALHDREADLQRQKMHLQETNTALKVLLKRRDADRRELEGQVVYNVMKLVRPYLDKLRSKLSDEQQLAYLSIIEANLDDLTSGFARRLSLEYYGLTSAELKVANFIRQGKRSPDIARLMGLSKRTVEAHRQGIRRKLRILNKKVNLRTFLLTLS